MKKDLKTVLVLLCTFVMLAGVQAQAAQDHWKNLAEL